MATFGGFIASALGGAAKGYGEGAQMEMKKQAELDLKKQMLDAETEKALRIDDIKRQRDVTYARAEVANAQDPETIAAAARAQAAKYNELVKAGVPAAEARMLVAQGTAAAGTREALASINAAADVVEGKAKLKGQTDLLPDQRDAALVKAQSEETSQADLRPIEERMAINAAASKDRVTTATAGSTAAAASAVTLAGAQAEAKVTPQLVEAFTQKYKASQEFEKLKAGDLTTAKAAELKALVADTAYMDALKKQNSVLHAHLVEIANINATKDIKVAEIRADSSDERTEAGLEIARLKRLAEANKPSKGPGSTNPTTADLQRQVTAAENALAAKLTVKKTDLNEELGVLQKRTDSTSKDKLAKAAAEIEALAAARKRLLEWSKTPAAAAPAAAAPAAAASGGPVAAPGARPSLDSFRK